MSGKNELTELLRPHVGALEAAEAAGDNDAGFVIAMYQLHVAQPNDPGASGLCRAYFDTWLNKRRPSTGDKP